MALYLGDKQIKINYNSESYRLNIITSMLITNGNRLLSSEQYIFKTLNGAYLTCKEEQ